MKSVYVVVDVIGFYPLYREHIYWLYTNYSVILVSWRLTDLAGAETTPLGGCEKFVIKFPMAVLNSFLRSFEFVQKIADQTETEVNEESPNANAKKML